jgi:tRNA modification GTPase
MASDTIFALSSGSGAAGIAIIRISGPAVRAVLGLLVGGAPSARRAVLRDVLNPVSREKIDSGVILFFPGPNSFTGEDLAELQVHGSLAVIRQILRSLGGMPGLRAADAGEFSYRAFTNGKMDLIEIEALGDLLAAETEAQARLARVYQQNLRLAAARWREALVSVLSLTEAYIDFSDEGDVGEEIDSTAEREIESLALEIEETIKGLSTAERIRRGYRIAVLGPPNAGKSSLINALANRDIAITSPIPGTTRDTIEVHLDLKGLPVILIDTAGLRESHDPLELAGIERAKAAAVNADLVVWLSPAADAVTSPFANAFVVLSKSDEIDSDTDRSNGNLHISSTTGQGLNELIVSLQGHAAQSLHVDAEAILVGHERQASELQLAASALRRAARETQAALEIRAEELRVARMHLDRLTGRIAYDEVLGAIFSRFCIGK